MADHDTGSATGRQFAPTADPARSHSSETADDQHLHVRWYDSTPLLAADRVESLRAQIAASRSSQLPGIILEMQRRYGNRMVQRIIAGPDEVSEDSDLRPQQQKQPDLKPLIPAPAKAPATQATAQTQKSASQRGTSQSNGNRSTVPGATNRATPSRPAKVVPQRPRPVPAVNPAATAAHAAITGRHGNANAHGAPGHPPATHEHAAKADASHQVPGHAKPAHAQKPRPPGVEPPLPQARHPHLAPAMAQTAQALRTAQASLRQAAATERAAITRHTEDESTAIAAESGAKTKQTSVIFAGARTAVKTQFAEARDRVGKLVESHVSQASQNGEQRVSELHNTVAEEQKNASAVSEDEAAKMESTGTSEAGRIQSSAAETHNTLQGAARQAAAQVHSTDSDVIDAVRSSLSDSVQEIMDKVQERATDLASSATDNATSVAADIRQAGLTLVSHIGEQSTGEGEQGLRQNTDHLAASLQAAGKQMVESFTHLEGQSTSALGDAEARAASGIAASAHGATTALHGAKDQVLDHVHDAEHATAAQMHSATAHAMDQLNHHPDAASMSREDAAGFADGATTALHDASATSSAVFSQVSKSYAGRMAGVRSHFSKNLGHAVTAAQAAGTKATSDVSTAIGTAEKSVADAAQTGIKDADDAGNQSIAQFKEGLHKPVDDARKTWADQRDKAAGAVTADIDKGIAQNNQVRAEAPAKLTETAIKAADDAQRSLASRILSGIWDGIKTFFEGLLVAVLVLLVVWVLVMVGAALLGITLAAGAALEIALAVVGVGFLLYSFVTAMIHRSEQFWARFGSDIPWYAKVGGFFWVFGAAVGDAFGVSGILEGILGHDLVSGEDLSPEERAKRATMGALTIGFMFLLRGLSKKFGTVPKDAPPELPPGPKKLPPGPDPKTPDPVRPPDQTVNPPAPDRPPDRPPEPAPYDPTTKSDAQLLLDSDPTPRTGETPAEAQQRARAAENEIAERKVRGLGNEPRQVDVRADDAKYVGQGAHTVDNHGADITLRMPRDAAGNRPPTPTGVRSIEGRIFGDTGWNGQANTSFKWSSDAVMNSTINNYIRANWEQIRLDLAVDGRHANNFNAPGGAVGEGFFNPNQALPGPLPRTANFMQTSLVRIVIQFVPGPPPDFFVLTSFPNALGAPPY